MLSHTDSSDVSYAIIFYKFSPEKLHCVNGTTVVSIAGRLKIKTALLTHRIILSYKSYSNIIITDPIREGGADTSKATTS